MISKKSKTSKSQGNTSRDKKMKKILLLGSGALKIGEAGEFDYSGSQAIKALKEEGIKVVLVNPNIATIQTSEGFADEIYFLPVTPYFVAKIIEKERPDGLMLSFGGQTALNCGVALTDQGVLKKYNVKVVGTPVKTIKDTEDRDLFVQRMHEIGLKVPENKAVTTVKQALIAAEKITYPVILRVAFALGGKGSGLAHNKKELEKLATQSLSSAQQVLIEKYLGGWKEIEYEVVRDSDNNCITVCNMENFDPLGIHTGESIVVAPSQTLTNREYHLLREISLKAIRHLGIIGECNIQFAVDPHSEDYRIIEVNARLSRSSALASKATGYPLAFVATKLSLGHSLSELPNSITKVTKSCFEPALDYVVVKIPRWDLQKFSKVSRQISSEMKSVGEVMAIGRTFEESFQKAIRMLDIGMNGLVANQLQISSRKDIETELRAPTDMRAYVIAQALGKGLTVEKISQISGIDPWFLYKIENIVNVAKEISKTPLMRLSPALMLKAKQLGFSDKQISIILKTKEELVKDYRWKKKIRPVVKQIDTLAAEYPAITNYLYLTYNGSEDDIEFNKKPVVVLGSGTYRIGSSVEFDWCCVTAINTAKKIGKPTVMINYNPETVSTDYDICDRLYFEELSFESVQEIYAKEKPEGLIISMGGQIPNTLAMKCYNKSMRVLGTSPLKIDQAEDRHKFSALLDKLGVDQPAWKQLTTLSQATKFADDVKYPVLIRPSYVLSGAAMNVALNKKDLVQYLKDASSVSKEHPVVISKFITGAKEIEIDAVAVKGDLKVWAISEHVENAGVHSGDATVVLPPQKTYLETVRRIKKVSKRIAKSLNITGPFNIQFIAKENEIKVIECNLRASRSFPFVSKVTKTNFIDLATKGILGEEVKAPDGFSALDLDYVGVKAPQFSFSRLKGADPILAVEMSSTGEVGCLGKDLHEAFLKSIISTGFAVPQKAVLLSIGGEKNKVNFLPSVKQLHKMGFEIYATEHTAQFYKSHGIPAKMVYKAHNLHKKNNVVNLITLQEVDLVINITDALTRKFAEDDYVIRRNAVDFSIPLVTNPQIAKLFVNSISRLGMEDLKIKPWSEY